MRGFGGDNVEEDSSASRRHLVALLRGRIGADAAWRAGGPKGMQARYRALLQSGPARPRPHQGLHEGAHPRTVGALQGGTLPGVVEAMNSLSRRFGLNAAANRAGMLLAGLVIALVFFGTGTRPA